MEIKICQWIQSGYRFWYKAFVVVKRNYLVFLVIFIWLKHSVYWLVCSSVSPMYGWTMQVQQYDLFYKYNKIFWILQNDSSQKSHKQNFIKEYQGHRSMPATQHCWCHQSSLALLYVTIKTIVIIISSFSPHHPLLPQSSTVSVANNFSSSARTPSCSIVSSFDFSAKFAVSSSTVSYHLIFL